MGLCCNVLGILLGNVFQIKAKYKKASSGIAERSHNLMQLTEELDRLKIEMEQRGSLLSNTGSLDIYHIVIGLLVYIWNTMLPQLNLKSI